MNLKWTEPKAGIQSTFPSLTGYCDSLTTTEICMAGSRYTHLASAVSIIHCTVNDTCIVLWMTSVCLGMPARRGKQQKEIEMEQTQGNVPNYNFTPDTSRLSFRSLLTGSHRSHILVKMKWNQKEERGDWGLHRQVSIHLHLHLKNHVGWMCVAVCQETKIRQTFRFFFLNYKLWNCEGPREAWEPEVNSL